MKPHTIVVAGEELELRPERALHWPRTRTLVVADAHFGKAAAFRAHGVFVPEATTAGTLARLDQLLDATHAERVVFVGDFLHAKEGRHADTFAALEAWRERHAERRMILVRGNHDLRAGDPPRELRIECTERPLLDPPFAFAHHPRDVADHYALTGHLHPAVPLAGAGRQSVRLPCFWFRERVAVLPAFGEFTGAADVEPAPGDRVFVIAGAEVVEPATRRSR
jgi:uncharacterized protein